MAADKDVEAKKDPGPKKDVDTRKATATGEQSIEYLVDGLTEEQLKGVSGGLAGAVPTVPMKCDGVSCLGLITTCYTFCRTMVCPKVDCAKLQCNSFDIL